ncbi:MAG: rRNA maturation RNase YbeY [Anaerolineae bacterium]|jgi:probable rRNA maturation factor|nr:rRNA maturation RNase YbeY [Anaerolineae bacterium]
MTTTININCPNRYKNNVNINSVHEVALFTLSNHGIGNDYELTIAFVSDSRIRTLNKTYLENDAVTDVLAFPAMEPDPYSGQLYLGDVAISVPQAARQAVEHNISTHEEITILIVHGILHLLGYDHDNTENKAHMWKFQNAILSSLDNPILTNAWEK